MKLIHNAGEGLGLGCPLTGCQSCLAAYRTQPTHVVNFGARQQKTFIDIYVRVEGRCSVGQRDVSTSIHCYVNRRYVMLHLS